MVVLSGLEFALPNQSNKSKTIANVIKSSLAFAVSDIYTKHANTTLVICEDFVSAYQLERELHFLDKQAIVFPDWETLPYDSF
jgi:transcription-repair coupling factor (superfamily II helicase)